jgi:hypothetical protein
MRCPIAYGSEPFPNVIKSADRYGVPALAGRDLLSSRMESDSGIIALLNAPPAEAGTSYQEYPFDIFYRTPVLTFHRQLHNFRNEALYGRVIPSVIES